MQQANISRYRVTTIIQGLHNVPLQQFLPTVCYLLLLASEQQESSGARCMDPAHSPSVLVW